MLFVDYNDAFNSIYWHKIREVLEELGVPEEIIHAAMALMEGVTTRVETPHGLTDPIDVWAGVLQGDTLAPFLILRRASERFPGIHFKRADGSPASLSDLSYADDLSILFEARPGHVLEEDIARYVACLARISAEYGLTINLKPKKTEIIYVNVPNPSPVLAPGGVPIPQTQSSFASLGCAPAIQSHLAINARKRRIFDSLVLSIYTYGMEAWTISPQMLTKISGTYTQMVRYVKNVRVQAWRCPGSLQLEGASPDQHHRGLPSQAPPGPQPNQRYKATDCPPHYGCYRRHTCQVPQAQSGCRLPTARVPPHVHAQQVRVECDCRRRPGAAKARSRTPAEEVKRVQARLARAPPKNLLPFEDLKDRGVARGRQLRKAVAARLCSHPGCGIKCEVHCLQCAQPLAGHTSHLTLPPLSCQLCHLLWPPSCPQPDSPRLEDAITPALAGAFLCHECYGVCRLYPMPPEARARHLPQ